MPSLDLPTTFVNNVNTALSAEATNQLITAAEQLDGWSYRMMAATASSATNESVTYNLHSAGDVRLWWGDLRYRAGMEDLVVSGYAANTTPSSSIKVYLNGSPTAAATITPASSWSATIDISTGYTDGQIIAIEIRTFGNASKTSEYLVRDVYGTPITVASSWPSMPTFAGTYDSARLNALINACSYLYERINAVPIIPTMGHLWSYGTHKAETRVQWAGSVARVYSEDILRIWGAADIHNIAEHFEVLVNGVVAYTSPTYGWIAYGQPLPVPILLGIDISGIAVGSRADVVIRSVVTTGGNLPHVQTLNSRYSFFAIRSQADVAGYPVYSPPALLAQGSISATTLNTRLNALSAMLSDIKSRLDSNSFSWDRARASRRRHAADDVQNSKVAQIYTPIFVRHGDTLIVSGKNVNIGWGARMIDLQEDAWRLYTYKYDKTQSLITGDAIDTQIVPLDSFVGLYPGQVYAIIGEQVNYTAEYLS
jgi:hypothetical protein